MAIAKRIIYGVGVALALSGAAHAAANPFTGSTKMDNNAPIEINADTLEVFQEENRAVFSGHVVAIQGKVRLKADKMNVFYRGTGDDGKKKSAAPGQDAIQKIEVTGNVFLSTPQETASGASGLYDVENQQIHLNDHVVLTRDKNVLKGDRLVYNFATGKSTIVGGAGTTQNGGKERVRALFVPDKKQEKK